MEDNIYNTKEELILAGYIMLDKEKHDQWKQIVNQVVIDKDKIRIIRNAIHIISILNHGGTPEAAFKTFKYQSHAGETEEIERTIVSDIADQGKDFYEISKDFKSVVMDYKKR